MICTSNKLLPYLLAGFYCNLRIDCAKVEEGLKTTLNSECALNALVIDNPLKHARSYLDETIQMWIYAEDSLEIR